MIYSKLFEEIITERFTKSRDSLRFKLATDSIGVFIVRIFNNVLIYIKTYILAKILGATEFGIYSFAFSWLSLFISPSDTSITTLLMREISSNYARNSLGRIKGVLLWSQKVIIILSIITIVILFIILWGLSYKIDKQMFSASTIALITIPFILMQKIYKGGLQGFKHVIWGAIPDGLFSPLIIIIFILAAYVVVEDLNVNIVIILHVISAFFTLIIFFILFFKKIPINLKLCTSEFDNKLWLRSSVTMMFIGGLSIANYQIPKIILGILKGAKEVGIFTITLRGALLITFVLGAINKAIAPTISEFFSKGEISKLQYLVKRSARIILIISAPVAIVLILFSGFFLSIFGVEFIEGKNSLIILCLGQLINASMGSVGIVLLMTGREKDVSIAFLISAVLNFLFCLIFVPIWSVNGAALATSVSTILWNLILVVILYKKLRINSTAFF